MDLGIRGRTAVVGASTGGLGEAVARALGAEGAKVVVSGRRGALAKKIASELPDAIGVEVDITSPTGPQELIQAAIESFAKVDILVLNGPGPEPSRAVDVTETSLIRAMEQLLLPQQRLVSLALPGMREQRWGRVLALGSLGVKEPIPYLALSNIGRAALGGYLKTLAGEVGVDGITVNLLMPGRIETDRVRALDAAKANREGRSADDVAQESQSAIPLCRYGTPAEFGATAAFVCGESAAYISGTAIRCDGGMAASL